MLDPDKIKSIAQSYSPQELFAALVWQRQFNNFDGEEVIKDLCENSSLWASFLFSKPIYAPDEEGLSFSGMIDTLLAMANYRPMPASSIIYFVPYPADTLYILTENQDTIVSKLLDFGKKWRSDVVDIIDGTNDEVAFRLRRGLRNRLQNGLEQMDKLNKSGDAVIISYWWD